MTGSPSEPTLSDVLAVIERLDTDIQGIRSELTASRQDLSKQVERWDERFFQLSRDTLNFTRNVVVIAAVTAVLIPLLRDVTPLIIDIVREVSN